MTHFGTPRALGTATLLVAALLTGACKKDDANTGANTAGETVAATPPAAQALTVADVETGKHIDAEKKISDGAGSFAPMDTIYTSVKTSGAGTNRTLMARWTFQDGQKVDEQSATISPTGDAHTEFHMVKPGGWPKGKYTLAIMLDGAQVQTKEIEVK